MESARVRPPTTFSLLTPSRLQGALQSQRAPKGAWPIPPAYDPGGDIRPPSVRMLMYAGCTSRVMYVLNSAFRFRPSFRYPYYSDRGDGVLLYGYGDKYLYTYTDFKTLHGYYKRR